jgi:hypothetical protein
MVGCGVTGDLASLDQRSNSQIYHIDVEQGDATLFVSPSGRTWFVNSGKDGHGSGADCCVRLGRFGA